jgi:uncharacterized membrane protein
MTAYFILKYFHMLGAIVILGTGSGIAFFMLMAHRSGDAAFIAQTASVVVIADTLFTATAVIAQPITGGFLMWFEGMSTPEPWLVGALALYAVAGLFWVPVVFMQIEMRDLARRAVQEGTPLPARYFALYDRWFMFGFPGFGSVALILWLMIAKPNLW